MYLATLADLYQGFIYCMGKILGGILRFLPLSPFRYVAYFSLNSELLMFLNYLLPIQQIVFVTEGWLAAITTFYIYQAILKWLKACS